MNSDLPVSSSHREVLLEERVPGIVSYGQPDKTNKPFLAFRPAPAKKTTECNSLASNSLPGHHSTTPLSAQYRQLTKAIHRAVEDKLLVEARLCGSHRRAVHA